MKFLIALFVFLTNFSFAQTLFFTSENIADCNGATAINFPGNYTLQFPDSKGKVDDIEAYPNLKTVAEKNSLWCYYVAPYDGKLIMSAIIASGTIKMIAFQNDDEDLCVGLQKGTSEIKRMIDGDNNNEVSFSLKNSENSLYPVNLKKGQKIMFLFNTQEKGKPMLNFTLQFDRLSTETNVQEDKNKTQKIIDIRKNNMTPHVNLKVRDLETGNPIIANIEVNGIKQLSTLYNGSDLLFSADKSGQIDFKCDAQGYFFVDRNEAISCRTNQEFTIWMEKVSPGKSLRLDDIEFQPGTSALTIAAEDKLRRLKDFLSLNSAIKIEIQGHVHSTGENCFATQKLSEARARRVFLFLEENGIDKNRMAAVGYGNTQPIFEDPQFSYEEQANRRVEIKVI